MAMQTKRIRLGTLVTPLARCRPWKLARETVSLDHLSNGRLVLGVGLGDTGESLGGDISFSHFDEEMDARQRGQMLDEGLAVLAGLWSAEPFHFEGKYYRVKEVTLLPGPIQKPRIPVWVGGGFPLKGPVQRAARWDSACLYKHRAHFMTPDDVRTLRGVVQTQHQALSAVYRLPGLPLRSFSRMGWTGIRHRISAPGFWLACNFVCKIACVAADLHVQ